MTVDHHSNMCRVTERLSLKEAMESSNAKNWQEAADLEYESLLENDTWDLVDLPKDRKAVGSRWVFKVKHHSDGRVERYKFRLIAKGYAQLYGADYDGHQWYDLALFVHYCPLLLETIYTFT